MSTGIEWTDVTWNPVRGCSRTCAAGTSQSGCGDNTGGGCYAEQQAGRIVRMGKGKPTPYDGLVRETATGWRWTGKTAFDARRLADPLTWKKPRRVFVDSMSDLFHDGFTNEQIAAVFGVMAACPQHQFQILTKRAKRMREWFEWLDESIEEEAQASSGADCSMSIHDARTEERTFALMHHAANELGDGSDGDQENWYNHLLDKVDQRNMPWPLPNVWIGVSVENQAAADERIPELLRTPAAVRFLSCEPLLGPLNLSAPCPPNARPFLRAPDRISWVIAGCESGPGARSCDVDWLRSLVVQCKEAGAAFFLKQAVLGGGITCGAGSKSKSGGVVGRPYLDGLQYQEFPR